MVVQVQRYGGSIAGGYGLYLSRVVSYAINPIILPPLALLVILRHFGAPVTETVGVVLSALFFFGLLPLAFIVYMVASDRARTLELRDRSKRKAPLLITLASGAAGFLALSAASTTGRPVILACGVCFVLNVALALVVTLYWKISLHVITLAAALASLLFVSMRSWPWSGEVIFLTPERVAAALFTIPLLMWARVRSGAHTRAQVFAGAVGGFALPYLELWLMLP